MDNMNYHILAVEQLGKANKLGDKIKVKNEQYNQSIHMNYHMLTVKYLGATNTLGSRIKITSERYDQSITIAYDYSMNSTQDMATAELEKRGYEIVGRGEGKNIDYLISETFEPLNN